MSLSNCLKKVAINDKDKKAILAKINALDTSGMTPEQISTAENNALQEYISEVDSSIDSLANTISKAGGDIAKDGGELNQEGLSLAQSKGYEGGDFREAVEWLDALEKFGPNGMTLEARMKRAEAMGFDTGTVYYHGTAKDGYVESTDIKKFEKDKIGDRWSADDSGFFFTTDKSEAGYYASSDRDYNDKGSGQGAVYPVFLKMESPLVVDETYLKKEGMGGILPREGTVSFWDYNQSTIKEFADKAGSDSILIKDGDSGMSIMEKPENIRSIHAAFDPDNSSSANILAQDGEDRGSFKPLGVNPEMESSIIKLSKSSDMSTFLHESAHLFLDLEARFSDGELTADQKTILEFLGLESFDQLIITDAGVTDKQREAHEKFAETFEVYLREGKAPSNDLVAAFAAFKDWLTRIYRTLRDERLTRANLTPEIKNVFDRLLASEQEIEALQSSDSYGQLFKSKEQAGMTDSEWKAYQEQAEKAKNRTRSTLDERLIKELYRRKTKEWAEERTPIIEQELERLKDSPAYQLADQVKRSPMDRDFIRDMLGMDKLLSKEERSKAAKVIDTSNDSLLVAAAKSGGLDLTAWESEGIDPAILSKDSDFNNRQVFGMPIFRKNSGLTPDGLAEIANENGYGMGLSANDVLELVNNEINGDPTLTLEGIQKRESESYSEENQYDSHAKKLTKLENFVKRITKAGGVEPHFYQEIYEFDTVEQMLEVLATLPPIKKAAKENAENIMIEKYGDILNDGTIELEVRESVHNKEQARLLLAELKALGKNKPAIDRVTLKNKAKEMIASMKFKEIQPSKYYQAEIRAAKNAVENPEQAFDYKVQQLANHYLYKEAVDAKERMVKGRKYVRGMQTRVFPKNVVAPEYSSNIRLLANVYNMKQGDAGKVRDIDQLVNWMVTQVEDENNFINFDIYDQNLINIITDKKMSRPVDYEIPTFEDMTFADMTGLVNQLKHMRFIGGKLAEGNKEDIVARRDSMAESIIKNGGATKPVVHEETPWQKRAEFVKGLIYSHRRIGGILETLDGYNPDGPMMEVYQRINESSNTELELTSKTSEMMDDAFKDVLPLISGRKFTTITKADGFPLKLSHRARFTLALNWGNKGNREAVLEGLNNKFNDTYTEADVMKMLSTMSESEILALDKVWQAKEHLWPKMSGVEVRIKGVAPEKVEPAPFTINGIKVNGGHYRLHYKTDPNDSARSNISVDKTADNKVKISTASSLHARVGSGGRQVDLELSHLFQDITEDIHYISYAEMADEMNAIFKGVDNPVVSSISAHYGESYYDNLVETVSSITQPAEPAKGIWKILQRVRSNLTYGYLAFSVRNVVQQPIAITNTFSQLGLGQTLKGVIEFYKSPIAMKEHIRNSSPFMKNRTQLVNREAKEQLSKIDSIHPKLGAMKNLAFAPQTFVDSLIAYPTWLGAKSKFQQERPLSTEQEANSYADEMVAKTIGSGLSKDLGSILNKGEAYKQVTFMGTFFNLTWNLHVENAQLLKRGKISGMEYARRLGWMAIAPAIMSMYILDDLPSEDEDKITHALKEVGLYNMSSLFLVRDLASGLDGFSSSIAGLKFADGTARVTKEMQGLITGDEEFDAQTVASILRGLQPLVPIPGSGQAARMLEGGSDPKQDIWGMLVEGKERNK